MTKIQKEGYHIHHTRDSSQAKLNITTTNQYV